MPTKERVADMTVTTTQLAAVLGITNRRVQQLTQDGVLTTCLLYTSPSPRDRG